MRKTLLDCDKLKESSIEYRPGTVEGVDLREPFVMDSMNGAVPPEAYEKDKTLKTGMRKVTIPDLPSMKKMFFLHHRGELIAKLQALVDMGVLQKIVGYEFLEQRFVETACDKLGISAQIIQLDKLTRGQAETAMFASELWVANEPLLIYNIDTYVEPGQLRAELIRGAGFIPCFTAEGTHWSFVKLGDGNKAVEVREKVRISDHCSIGAYYFESARLSTELYADFYSGDTGHVEQYIAPIYNLLIERGAAVYIQDIPAEFVHVLGTPAEVAAFAGGGDGDV